MTGEIMVVVAATVLVPLCVWIVGKYVPLGFGPCAGPPSEQKKLAQRVEKVQ